MILWRGITDAERGFMDYLKSEGLKVNFVIRDCNKDKSCLPEVISEVKELKPDLVYTFGTSVTLAVAGTKQNASSEKNITEKNIKEGSSMGFLPSLINWGVRRSIKAERMPNFRSSKKFPRR